MFTAIEQEAIVLNAIWEMVDDMVNYSMFVRSDNLSNTNLLFNTGMHGRLFNILLADFLSLPQKRGSSALPFDLPQPPNETRLTNLTFLFYLRRICSDPKLNTLATSLAEVTETFGAWLESETFIEGVWLPTINVNFDARLTRLIYLKVCGDIAKHSFTRLEVNVKRICKILSDHGHTVDEGMGYAVLPEFYEWFHDHLFIYHSSTIAEFLNNIRWNIFSYLEPEYLRSYERVDPDPAYRFKFPTGIEAPLAKEMYWVLMNKVRARPHFPKFTVSSSFKSRY